MADVDLWRCTTAHGVCEGLRVICDGGRVAIGDGYGYCCGCKIEGGHLLDVSQQRGWHWLQVSPAGAFCGPRTHDGALALAALHIQRGEVIALRDVRTRLYAWQWLGPVGALVFLTTYRERVLRVQGAVQVGGLWQLARAHVPFRVGQMLEPSVLTVSGVNWDAEAFGASGLILETVGVTE